ncbi:type VI secretion system lysozyme-related protein [Paraburkholderia atlantica]|uniref:Type VI secretion system lysozyme-related protein n=1 Tax=Paraburkholderia atlantica TaxID=2654982 RepID=D5WFZ9_PARAM|nr:type VI secretion system baseplate subunit TssE [Paraburkholderia atlantica]ADG19375.1 type VI secretion system lysozyme-related protein [Paraburkholderia atlantica]
MPAIVIGSPMPLFDRLAASGEAQLAGEDGLRASIARELTRLLNTRSRLTFDEFAESDGSVIDYGVPDFSHRSLHSGPDRDLIAAAIGRAISLFEPRLANVEVAFAFSAAHAQRAILTISAQMRAGQSVTHVAFELAANGHTLVAA